MLEGEALGVVYGLVVGNATEWWIYGYVLYGVGKKKTSDWSFHGDEHHRNARQNQHIGETYERSLLGWHTQTKEALGLLCEALVLVLLLWVWLGK